MIALGYILGLCYGAACLLFALFLSRFGAEKKVTRKIVHIMVGFEWVILYNLHGTTYHFLIVCLAFLVLLAVSYKKKLLKMISSDGDNAPGTVYYAVSMSAMAAISMAEPRFMLPFGVAVFVTSLGDGFAGLVGQLVKTHNPRVYQSKTLVGALSNFVFSTATAFVFMLVFSEMDLSPFYCIVIGAVATGVELISGRGLDNISLPLTTSALTYFLTVYPSIASNYILPILLTPFVIVFVLEKRALTRGGLAAALFLDVAVTVSLGNFGFLLLLTFLMIGVLTDKLKKRGIEDKEEKGARRDFAQVMSNGLVPIIAAVLYFVLGERAFLIAFVAALSEALGDTAASSLGSYSKFTVDIFKLRRCERGMSGGVSLIGTVSAAVFSAVIPMIALLFSRISLSEAWFVTIIAFIGVLFDSLLGSVFQAKYRCPVCNKLTEKRVHCDESTFLISGARFIRNDTVNALSTLFVATLTIVLFILF